MSISVKVRGVLFAVFMFLSTFLGITFMTGWLIPVLFLNPALYRQLLDAAVGWWEYFAVSMLELMLGIKVVITGDQMQPGERSLIIMNHRTRLDWMYLWSVLIRQSGVKTEKIILKAPLKNIPGAGWAMQCGTFIFINRNWEEDKAVLTDMIDYFSNIKHKTQIMIFPEGTDLTPRTKARSDEFARKNNLEPYNFVLHPRTTGFTFVSSHMRKRGMLDAIYDITVAYPHNFPQSEPDLICGNFPREVHFHVRRYDATDLPSDDSDLEGWCKGLWNEKEEKLKHYYQEKRFNGESAQTLKSESQIQLMLIIAFLYWTVFVCGINVLLIYSSLARWFLIFQCIFFVYMSLRGGYDIFQAQYCNNFFNSAKLK